MSMIFTAMGESGIVFVGDGVVYDTSTGALTKYASKLQLLPEIGTVMGFTGLGGAGRLFAMGADGRYADFDDMLERVLPDLKELHESMTWNSRMFRHPNDKLMSVVMGGWSDDRQQWEAYRVTSYEKESHDPAAGETGTLPAWELHRITTAWASFQPLDEAIGRTRAYDDDPDLDLVERGIRVICAGRLSSGQGKFADPGYYGAVGGFVQVAILDDNGIWSKIVHRWPEDAIGEPLNPTKGGSLPPDLMEKDASRVVEAAVPETA